MKSAAGRSRRSVPLFAFAVVFGFLGTKAAALPPGTLIGNSGGQLLSIDPTTGDRATISGSLVGSGTSFSSRPLDLVLESSGDYVVADFDVEALLRVDGVTGDRTILASDAVGSGGSFRPAALEIDFTGQLIAYNSDSAALEFVDPSSGNRTVFSSSSIGTGPNYGSVQDILRVGKFTLPSLFSDLLVVDSVLDAVLAVDSVSGDRTVVSNASTGTGPAFVTPRAIARTVDHELVSTTYYVVDSGLNAVLEVDTLFGDRTIVSSNSVGTGPSFVSPQTIWPRPDGQLLVGDVTAGAVFLVDPATGDRSTLSDPSTGTGPGPGSLWNLAAVPQGSLALSFESLTPGSVPPYGVFSPIVGEVTVEEASGFAGPITAADGDQVIYLTTGAGDRGEPTGIDLTGNGTDEFDESYLTIPVLRGQNDPSTLRFKVDYMTAEGTAPDPVDIFSSSNGIDTTVAQVSMGAPNGSHTALTGFSGGAINGPDGSSFGTGHSTYIEYEIEVDFPGGGIYFQVQDEGDGIFDTAIIVDEFRFVPEPEPALVLLGGSLVLALLVRTRGRRALQPSR